jgi:hypothetical protein
MKKNLDQLFLLLVTLQKWFHGTERIPVENGLSRGRLELFAMWHEVALLWRAWDWSAWAWSTFIFLLLVGLNYVPRFGGVLWLGLAPILSGIMLLLDLIWVNPLQFLPRLRNRESLWRSCPLLRMRGDENSVFHLEWILEESVLEAVKRVR